MGPVRSLLHLFLCPSPYLLSAITNDLILTMCLPLPSHHSPSRLSLFTTLPYDRYGVHPLPFPGASSPVSGFLASYQSVSLTAVRSVGYGRSQDQKGE